MIVALVRDLMFATRIGDAADAAGRDYQRVDDPADLPPAASVDLLLVDWGDRGPDWGEAIRAWSEAAPEPLRPRIVLYGPHTDLEAHAAARDARLGPMLARSSLAGRMRALLDDEPQH